MERLNHAVGCLGGLMFALLPACGPPRPSHAVDPAIRYYSDKVAHHPRHYPAYSQLGASYLAKARLTLDPADVAAARGALNRSLEIQPNFGAIKSMAAVCNFAHRFEETLRWGERAREAFPGDTGVTALLVEAYLGMGRPDEAAALLPPPDHVPDDFYIAAAQGGWLASQGRIDEAVEALAVAAGFARSERVTELIVWSELRAAGLLLDSARAPEARPYLEAASRLRPDDPLVRIHRAELLEAEDRSAAALTIYERLLSETPNPAIHARASAVARRLGLKNRAQHHFEAAEASFLRAIDAGEVYSLESLAALYDDANVNLEQALDLARRNLEFKRDEKAQATFASIKEKCEVPVSPFNQHFP